MGKCYVTRSKTTAYGSDALTRARFKGVRFTEDTLATLTGECLCGSIKFSLADEFLYSFYCHCSECRRFSGSAFSVAGGIQKENLTISSGKEHVRYYQKRDVSNMAFCNLCGSSLFSENFRKDLLHIRLGVLNEEPSLKPQAHVFVGSKVPWYQITDDLPQFETIPPSKNNET